MFRPPQSVLSYGAVAIATGILMLAAPRAAHAIAATLVQVTNTPVNPAVSQDVAKLASQNVLLVYSSGFGQVAPLSPGGGAFLQPYYPNDVIGTQFVVPTGQSLVVTTIDVFPTTPSPGVNWIAIGNESNVLRENFYVSNAGSTQLQFPNGLVFSAGRSVLVNYFFGGGSPLTITAHGYLTSN
jgi:hypothetical protein